MIENHKNKKKCSSCKEWKPKSEYHKNKSVKSDGFQKACKLCRSKENKAYYERKRDKRKEYQRKYRLKQKERQHNDKERHKK